ncbi:MAG: hypothetical protein L0I62_09610 [Gammaproteobacteria bacterium]|nr:hypothetical protein [Gammaproteobacteria bacterium]
MILFARHREPVALSPFIIAQISGKLEVKVEDTSNREVIVHLELEGCTISQTVAQLLRSGSCDQHDAPTAARRFGTMPPT